jgi:hypothetical protein
MSTAFPRIVKRAWEFQPPRKPTRRPLSVRIARPDEGQKIFDTLMLLAEENALAPVSEEKVRGMIARCRGPEPGQYRDGVIGLIDAPDGSIAATVGIIMGQWWYTNAWHCEEVWSFVHPDHRDHLKEGGENYAESLIDFSKWWGEQMGNPVLMGVLSTHRTLGKIRLYSRKIPLVGALYLWRGPNV